MHLILQIKVWCGMQTKDQAECFDDAKGSHASQSFIQDKEIKDIQDG